MNEAESPSQLHSAFDPQNLQNHGCALKEHPCQVPASDLIEGLEQDCLPQLPSNTFISHSSPLSFKAFFAEQCGRLATFIGAESSVSGRWSSMSARITMLCKGIQSKVRISFALLARFVFDHFKKHEEHQKLTESHQPSFAGRENQQLAKMEPCLDWSKTAKELLMMYYAICGWHPNFHQKPSRLKPTAEPAFAIVIESFDQAETPLVPAPTSQFQAEIEKKIELYKDETTHEREISEFWDQFTGIVSMMKLHNTTEVQYNQVYVTQKDFQEYIKKYKNDVPTTKEYKKLMLQLFAYRPSSIRNYLVVFLTDEEVTRDMKYFCSHPLLKVTCYRWENNIFKSIKQCWEKNKANKKSVLSLIQKQKNRKKSNPRQNMPQVDFLRLFEDVIKAAKTIADVAQPYDLFRYDEKFKESQAIDHYKVLLTEQKYCQEFKLERSVRLEKLLKETEQLMKESEKRLKQYSLWRDLFIGCKASCKINRKCQCQETQRVMQFEKGTLERLQKIRNNITSKDKKLQQTHIEAQPTITAVDPPSVKQKSPCKPQPVKDDESESADQAEESEMSGKTMKSKHKCGISCRGICKSPEGKKVKLRRGDYGEQELNLLNILAQVDLNEMWRAPCNVEESRISAWKQMGEKYRRGQGCEYNK